MTNPGIIELENEVLRGRLDECKAALTALAATVRRYIEPRDASQFCTRSEILRAVAQAEQAAAGRGKVG